MSDMRIDGATRDIAPSACSQSSMKLYTGMRMLPRDGSAR